MDKNHEEMYFSNDYTQFTSQTEKENTGKIFLKKFNHKSTASNIPTKIKKVETNIFSFNNSSNTTNSNLINPNMLLNENKISPKDDNLKLFPYKRRSTLVSNISNLSMNQNFLPNNFNLMSFFNINNKNNKGNNNAQLLPKINSYENITNNNNQTEINFKKINSNDIFINRKFGNDIRTNSVHERKRPKIKFSAGNIQNFNIPERKEKIPKKISKKLLKMKTFLNINKQLDFLTNEGMLKSEKEEENEENKKESKKGIKNQKLLYSKKVNNYIFKIYKAIETTKKFENKNKDFLKTRNKNIRKSIKISTKYYLENFNPKKYIKKIKNKIEYENIGNSEEIKSKIIYKSFDYIESYIFKNNKNVKKKQFNFDHYKDKNRLFLIKEKNSIVNKNIDEILLRKKIKHKSTVFKIYTENLLISRKINYHIYIKLNIMRHVLTKSEQDENLYFINLIKHLLYSDKKKFTIKLPLSKSLIDIPFSLFKRTSTAQRYIQSNRKEIYYLSLNIKFNLLDCETMIRLPEERKLSFNNSKKNFKILNTSIFIDNKSDPQSEKESENFSEIEKRIKKMSHRSKQSKKITYFNRIKLTNSSKILNVNLTKSIIKLRNDKNIKEVLSKKSGFNVKNLKRLYNNRNKNKNDESDSSDSFEYKKYSKKFHNNFLHNNNVELATDRTVKNDNEEIHQREKLFLFTHFIYFVEHSDYDKLYHWLKKSCKCMDLNYTFENGDTLLHLCIRHALPHYICKFLLHHGVDINSQNNDGDTALHIAVQNHRYKTVDFLIKMGASEYIHNKMRKICWECL